MSKILKIHYSSNRNITFRGVDELEAPDYWDELSEKEKEEYLLDEANDWLWGNVDVFAEVVDE